MLVARIRGLESKIEHRQISTTYMDDELKKVTLSEVAHLIMGQSPDSIYYTDEDIGYKFLQGCAEFGDKYPKAVIHCTHPKKIAPLNSILFSVRAPVGKINFADYEYCIGRGLAAIVPRKIDLDYLYQYLLFKGEELRNVSQGSTFESINSEQLRQVELIVPKSRKEQTRIAAVLSTIDRTIEQTEALIAKQQRIKTGLMQDLLTKGIDENGNIRSEETHEFKDSPLGRIPKEWKVSPLGNQFTLQRGFDITQEQQLPGQIPVVSSSGITSFHNKAMVNGPGVVIGRKGKLGQAYYLDCPFWPHDTTLWIKDFHGNYPLFAAHFLEYLKLERLDAATSVPTLNRNFVHPIFIAIPEYNEQVRITNAIVAFSFSLNEKQKYLFKINLLKIGLMQDLLTGNVSVSGLLKDDGLEIGAGL